MKLFRKIRQDLIDGNNLKTYLIYAVGEILLVMIGILLALQVNNWNQHRINKKKELKALIDLNEEFKLNKKRIEEKQNKRIALVPKLQNYINVISKGKADLKLFQDFHKDYIIGMTNPSNGVIDALISSGELALISNDSLKYLLADWKDQAGNLNENENILWESTLAYQSHYLKRVLINIEVWHDYNEKEVQEAFDALISEIIYRNSLIGFKGVQDIVIDECKLVLHSNEEILRLIKKEIDRQK